MAYHRINHFVDPNHLLTETKYSDDSTHRCDICLLDLAGLVGYGCDDCNIDIHKACAEQFEKGIDFFADRHTLKLIRTPSVDPHPHLCDLCREECAPASFVYRCTACDFDLHPLCSLLPETVDSPVHPGHRLRMITSPSVSCSACHLPLSLWHYVCNCSVNFKLHVACALEMMDEPTGAEDDHGGGPGIQGSYGAANQRGFEFGAAEEHRQQGRAADQRGCFFGAAEEHHQGRGVDQRGLFGQPQGSPYGGNPFNMFQQGNSPFIHGVMPNINIPGYGPSHHTIPGFPPIQGLYGPAAHHAAPVFPPIHGFYGPAAPSIPGFGPHHPFLGCGPAPAIPAFGPPPPVVPGHQNAAAVAKPSRFSSIAKFLLKQSADVAVNVATGAMFGPSLAELLLSAAFN